MTTENAMAVEPVDATQHRQLAAINHYVKNKSLPSITLTILLAMAIDVLDTFLLMKIGPEGYTELAGSLGTLFCFVPAVCVVYISQKMGCRWLQKKAAMPPETFHRYVEKWITMNLWGLTAVASLSLAIGVYVIAFIINEATPPLPEWNLGHGMAVIKIIPFLMINCEWIEHNRRTCRALRLKLRKLRR